MNIVLVRHGENKQTFVFEVSEELKDKVERGYMLLCDTYKGETYGIAVSNVITGDEHDLMDLVFNRYGATTPLRQVLRAVPSIPFQDIKKIPRVFSKPSSETLMRRLKDLEERGYFDTTVRVTKDGVLVDGFSAYLVAKMFDLPYLMAREITISDQDYIYPGRCREVDEKGWCK